MLNKHSARAIKVNKRELQKKTELIVKQIIPKLKGNKPLGNKGIAGPFSHTIKGPDGKNRIFKIVIRARPTTSGLYFDGGGVGTHRKTGETFVIAEINGSMDIQTLRNAALAPKNVNLFTKTLFKVLLHEITHVADPDPKPGFAEGMSGSRIPTVSEVDLYQYYNHPKEIRAYLQEIIHELQDFYWKEGMYKKLYEFFGQNKGFMLTLQNGSETWTEIRDYLTPKNKNYILNAVYTELQDFEKRNKIATTTPLPKSFPHNEIGLMTKQEFLQYQNENEKMHPSSAYDFDYKKMNYDWSIRFVKKIRRPDYVLNVYKNENGYLFYFSEDKKGKLAALFHKGTLYHAYNLKINEFPKYIIEDDGYKINKYKPVKYVSEYKKLVSNVVSQNLEKYPNLVRRFKSKGAFYQIRSEENLEKDKGVSMAVLNQEGYVVAQAQDEWGAALLVVAKEYRGKGIGHILGKIWFKINPKYRSGGFTQEGLATAIKIWEARVREFLSKGWYYALIKEGRITLDKVKKITADVSKKIFRPKSKFIPSKKEQNQKKILVFSQDDTFILYDSKFYDIPNYEYDKLKNTIYAYGFFRDSPHVGTYVFQLDYEPQYKNIATKIILQMAKDNNEKLYDGKGTHYSDFLELEQIPEVQKEGDYIFLKKDVINLKTLAKIEKNYRRKKDRFDEKYYSLLEIASYKWR